MDAACDRIAIIKDGRIVSEFIAEELKKQSQRIYRVTFADEESYGKFVKLPYEFASQNPKKKRARVYVDDRHMNRFISDISELNVADFHEFSFTLEDYFMQFYREDKVFEGVKS